METVVVTSDNKDDAYVATVLLFNNVKQMSLHKIGGWCLDEVYTNTEENHFITSYTNGKMWIRAESNGDFHTYSFGEQA